MWCGVVHGELRDTVCVMWYRTWRVKGYSLCGVVHGELRDTVCVVWYMES